MLTTAPLTVSRRCFNELYTFKTTKARLFVSRLNGVTEIIPQYPSQSHDFKKGARGSVVVLFFMFVDAPLNVRHGKRRGSDGTTSGWQEESSISFCSSQLLWHSQYHQCLTGHYRQQPGQSYPCPCEVCTSNSKCLAYQK